MKGVIDIKDFLVTMLAFREDEPQSGLTNYLSVLIFIVETTETSQLANSDAAARLFFRLFDINETGTFKELLFYSF